MIKLDVLNILINAHKCRKSLNEYILENPSTESVEYTEEIEIDLNEDEFYTLAINAHRENVSFNQYINKIIRKYVNENKKS